jgi:predicted secreted protein
VSEFSVQRSDSGKTIAMRVGDALTVRLPEMQTAGYQWVIEGAMPSALELRASNYAPPRGTGAGAAGERTFEMHAVAPGEAALKLKSRRSWESADAAGDRFEITVSVSALS